MNTFDIRKYVTLSFKSPVDDIDEDDECDEDEENEEEDDVE